MASSKPAIYSALVANLLIAVTKFIAAAATGSSAMVSEGIHSVVDTANEMLLLLGIKRSKKEADKARPFGYGKELYFWSFIVSILIFGVGGGISFYEGFTHLQHPILIKDPFWNYIVLGAAFLFDGISFIISLKVFNQHRGDHPFWASVKKSKDPTSFVVLFEDAADVAGLLVAFAGVYLSHRFRNPYLDGVSSIIIGCILTTVSIILAKESRSLLMGETASPKLLQQVVKLSESHPLVETVREPISMVMSPDEVLLLLQIKFKKELPAETIAELTREIKKTIQAEFPACKRIFIELD